MANLEGRSATEQFIDCHFDDATGKFPDPSSIDYDQIPAVNQYLLEADNYFPVVRIL